MKKKKLIIISACVLAIIVLVIGLFLIFNKPVKESNKKVTNTYEMYVKINPLVKLIYTETYEECLDDNGLKSICSYISSEVREFELINDDAKDIYKDLDFKGKTILDSLIMLCDTARDNHIGFKSLEITTNSTNLSLNEIKEKIKDGSKYETDYEVIVDFQEHIDKDKIIEKENELQEPKEIVYTVAFDSDSGSIVKTQTVKENELVVKPTNPVKEGYTFVEWQLNGKTYNFKTKVTKDITLNALWKKNAENNQSSNPTIEYVTVKFDSNGGTAFPASRIEKGTKVTKPNDPIKAGYEFIEWQLNGKLFDFSSEVTSNITLKATYKEVIPTLSKINLNDNILIYENGGGGIGSYCGGGYRYFATNLEELFPGKVNKYNQLVIISESTKEEMDREGYEDTSKYLLENEWNEKSSQITFNTAKEQNLITVFNKIKNTTTPGASKFQYNVDGHDIEYGYYGGITLVEPEKFKNLNAYLIYTYKKINDQIDNAVKGAYEIMYHGGCGDMPEEKLLTEEMCTTYNLPCGRW